MNRIILYGVNRSDGTVVSRVGSEVAWPILDWDAMQPENNFSTRYDLEKVDVLSIGTEYRYIKWTKKIPVEVKNIHREFWGFKPLRAVVR